MPWWHAIAERDHDVQNPTSPDKIRTLGNALRLTSHSHVLDIASGKGGPAIILAGEFGCRITAVERAPEFLAVARERINASGLEHRIDLVEQDAKDFRLEPRAYDVAMCLGASFIWDGLAGTLAALAPTVRHRGHVAVGEPFWRRWPLPSAIDDEGFVSLEQTVARFDDAGLALVALIASNEDDWDHYESLHWRALEDWLAENPEDPDAPEIRSRHDESRAKYVRYDREFFGWAIFAGRKRDRSLRGQSLAS